MKDNVHRLITPMAGERGMTELHYAAYCEDLAAVKRCVKAGFDINQQDDGGWTPLIWCIDMSATADLDVAEAIFDYLLAHGAKTTIGVDGVADLIEFARDRDERMGKHVARVLGGLRNN